MPASLKECRANKFFQKGQQNIFFTLATQKSHCPQKLLYSILQGAAVAKFPS